jgi:hypothetical protein
MVLARDSGNRFNESALALSLSSLEAAHGDPLAAFDYVTVATRNYHDSGSTTMIRAPLAVLAALFDRLGRFEQAATFAGFALSPFAAAGLPELTTAIAHLREVLGACSAWARCTTPSSRRLNSMTACVSWRSAAAPATSPSAQSVPHRERT